ncbi:MAG: hypothetical protein O7C59_11810 [Rickettsia endosymbiont of Ixodes persulcatus]|nr:hypothetical protein [Rickettsia endosymbiont of Ixodes persulcatus]
MPYSNKIISDFRTLAREEFEKTLSHCKTPQEIDSLCTALYLALNDGISREQVKNFLRESIENFDNLPHIEIMLFNLLELASNEGFELYATEGIIDLVNQARDGTSIDARYIQVPAFTSDKHSRDEKIEEAKTEFITVLREELYLQLGKAFSLSEEQKLDKIREQEKNNHQASKNQDEMANRPPPQPGSEAYVETELEMLRGLQSEFQREGNRSRNSRVHYAHMNLEDLLGNPMLLQLQELLLERRVSHIVEEGNSIRNLTNNIIENIENQPRIENQLRRNEANFRHDTFNSLAESSSGHNQAAEIRRHTSVIQPRNIEGLLENASNTNTISQNLNLNIIGNANSQTVNNNQRNHFPFFLRHRQPVNQLNVQENSIENTNTRSSSHLCTIL